MSDLPPPPLNRTGVPTPTPMTGRPRRPAPVTGAAAVLMVAGAFSLIAGLLWASGGRVNIDLPFLEGDFERIAALGLVGTGEPGAPGRLVGASAPTGGSRTRDRARVRWRS